MRQRPVIEICVFENYKKAYKIEKRLNCCMYCRAGWTSLTFYTLSVCKQLWPQKTGFRNILPLDLETTLVATKAKAKQTHQFHYYYNLHKINVFWLKYNHLLCSLFFCFKFINLNLKKIKSPRWKEFCWIHYEKYIY